jgi:uncharacterized protein YybS (DUF2232 family)
VQSPRTRETVEGALLAALTALLGILAFYTGFGWLLPLPALLAYLRHGGRSALLVAVVATVVLGLWIGPIAACGTFGFIAAQGLAPGWAIRSGRGVGSALVCMSAALLGVTAVGALGATLLWHTNVWAQTWHQFAAFLHAHATLLASAGLSPATVLAATRTVAPAAFVVGAVGESAAVYGLAALLLGRLKHPLPPLPPFRVWRIPAWGAWAVVGAAVLAAGGTRIHVAALTGAAWNVLLAAAFAYAVVALSFGYAWLRRRGMPRGTSALVVGGAAWLLSILGLSLALPVGGLLASQLDSHPPHPHAQGGDVS